MPHSALNREIQEDIQLGRINGLHWNGQPKATAEPDIRLSDPKGQARNLAMPQIKTQAGGMATMPCKKNPPVCQFIAWWAKEIWQIRPVPKAARA